MGGGISVGTADIVVFGRYSFWNECIRMQERMGNKDITCIKWYEVVKVQVVTTVNADLA
jgi:hypothetical protein